MTQSEIDEPLILAKMGQPFYAKTKVDSKYKYKYWFEDGQWAFKHYDSARFYCDSIESLRKFLEGKIRISEEEFNESE